MNKFRLFKKINHILLVVVVLFIFVYTPTIDTAYGDLIGTLSAIALITLLFVWLLTFILWCKCPHCGKRLGHKSLSEPVCPHCRKPLDEN